MDKFLSKSSSNPNLASKRPREDEESPDKWRKPKKFVTNPREVEKKKTPTDNRYKGLPVDTDEGASDSFLNACKKKTLNSTPSIIIELDGEWNHQKIRDTIEKYTKDFFMQYRGQKLVRVQCYSAKIHQLLKDGLRSEKIFFHTFTRKDEKLPKAVLKGLPKFAQQDIAAELDTLGFAGASVTELKTLHPTECPPILVQLPSGTDMTKFKKIKYLLNCAVEVQRYKPSKKLGTQCLRCQSFGHAARNCNRPPRCVKCSQAHPTWECTKKDREEPARCCNCQQDHPANYARCNERLKYIDRIESRRETLRKAMHSNTRAKIPAPSTWAQITRTGPSKKQIPGPQMEIPTGSNAETSEHPSKSLQPAKLYTNTRQVQLTSNTGTTTEKIPHDRETMEMLEILSTIQSIKQEFIKCKTFMEKVILILTNLGHYV